MTIRSQISPVLRFLILAAAAGITLLTMQAAAPKSVVAQLNNPLPCNLREEPIVIGDVTATYSCQAPGAFLTRVDTSSEPWTADHFTTDTQISEVTCGPEEVTVVPNPESP